MPGKDIGFVHIDEDTCEAVIDKMEGSAFNGGKMKISYGQIGPKARYDKNAPVATLHVGGLSELASQERIVAKFGVFGSIREVKFLPDKNIAFVEIQDEYASRAIDYLHGSVFYGKTIKVTFSKKHEQQVWIWNILSY